MRRHIRLCLLLLVALLAACAAPSGSGDEGVQVGMRLPDARFTTFGGDEVSVHEMRGSPVVINFWATWCGPCKEEIPMLQEAYDATQRTGFQLLAVTDELPSQVRGFVAENSMSFPILFDEGGRAGSRYRVQGIPTTFFLDSEGVIVARHTGALDAILLADYLALIMEQPVPADDAPAQPVPTMPPPAPPSTGDDTTGHGPRPAGPS